MDSLKPSAASPSVSEVEFRFLHPSEQCFGSDINRRASSSTLRCVSKAAMASSLLRPNLEPWPVIWDHLRSSGRRSFCASVR